DLLTGGKRGHDFLPYSLGLDAINQFLDDFEIDVGFEQGQADFPQCVLNVLLVKDRLAAQALEGSLKFFLKILKHRVALILPATNSPRSHESHKEQIASVFPRLRGYLVPCFRSSQSPSLGIAT